MLTELTLQLAAFPKRAWPRFVDLSSLTRSTTRVDATDSHAAREADPASSVLDTQGALPSPLRHAVGVSFLSVIATCLGSAFRPGATVGGVTLQSLAALVGYVGGAASAVELSSQWVSTPNVAPHAVSRFASGAVVPVAVSGVFSLIPLFQMSFALALAGAAVSVHSGWVGASAMLTLEGQPRKRAAVIPAGVAVGLVLLATLSRTVLPK